MSPTFFKTSDKHLSTQYLVMILLNSATPLANRMERYVDQRRSKVSIPLSHYSLSLRHNNHAQSSQPRRRRSFAHWRTSSVVNHHWNTGPGSPRSCECRCHRRRHYASSWSGRERWISSPSPPSSPWLDPLSISEREKDVGFLPFLNFVKVS